MQRVQQAGDLRCGVIPSSASFSQLNTEGNWQGFFIDQCRALAAAVLGDPDAVVFHEISPASRLKVLGQDLVDVVMTNTTWTIGREGGYGVLFPAIYLYDGQAVVAHKSKGWKRLEDVDKATLCVEPNSTTYHNMMEWAKRHKKELTVLKLRQDGNLASLLKGRCDMTTDDRISLMANVLALSQHPERYHLFDTILSREPLGPMVAAGDSHWFRVVRAVVHGLILAEELGIDRDNLEQQLRSSKQAESRRLLGLEGEVGAALGLDGQWAVRMIRAVGNYKTMYSQHFGKNSALKLPRGPNALWRDGGLLYAPVFR
uniref:Solute-binding protein family 3/N-terminal domain-containing protein n=1 Tax=Magnetococcus massalia (strain MO-1) TaxID=451514 RepID=A0A1S7LNK3_MAGMO|nr:Conserved protein of unknown function. putative amino-acid ABC transporter-binding protein [Candidatus Magnetococcus massalia]